MPFNALLYARVSTKDQKSIPDQFADMRDYCARRGWQVIGEFSESESGKRDTRPERQKLLALTLKRKKVDVVLVWKLNRWGRSTFDILATLMQLNERGVAFVSITEGFDLTTPMGRAMAGMLAVFAEYDRENIVYSVKRGIQSYREKHKRWGRPPRARAKAKRVLELWGQGKNKSEIEKETGISRASIRRIIEAESSKPTKKPTR